MASATFRLGKSSLLAGPYTYGSYDAAIDSTKDYYVKVELQSTAGVNSIAVTLPTADPVTIAAGLPAVTVDQATKTATFRLPNVDGVSINVRVVINGGVDSSGTSQAAYTKELQVNVLTLEGMRLMAVGETDQYSRSYGHTSKLNDALNGLTGVRDRRTDMSAEMIWYKCDDTDVIALVNSGAGALPLVVANTDYALGVKDIFGNSVSLFSNGDPAGFYSAHGEAVPTSGAACSIWVVVRKYCDPTVDLFFNKRIWGYGRDTDDTPWFELWEDLNGLPTVCATLVGGGVADVTAPTYAQIWPGGITVLTATYNGALMKLYWNDRLVSSLAIAGAIDLTDPDSRWMMGPPFAGADPADMGFQGNFLDAGCANRVMTAAEIADMYYKLVA